MINRILTKTLELIESMIYQAEETAASFIKFLRIRYLGLDQEKEKKRTFAKGVIPTALVNRVQQANVANQPLAGKVMNPINQVNTAAATVDPTQNKRNVKRERRRSRSSRSTSLR